MIQVGIHQKTCNLKSNFRIRTPVRDWFFLPWAYGISWTGVLGTTADVRVDGGSERRNNGHSVRVPKRKTPRIYAHKPPSSLFRPSLLTPPTLSSTLPYPSLIPPLSLVPPPSFPLCSLPSSFLLRRPRQVANASTLSEHFLNGLAHFWESRNIKSVAFPSSSQTPANLPHTQPTRR